MDLYQNSGFRNYCTSNLIKICFETRLLNGAKLFTHCNEANDAPRCISCVNDFYFENRLDKSKLCTDYFGTPKHQMKIKICGPKIRFYSSKREKKAFSQNA